MAECRRVDWPHNRAMSASAEVAAAGRASRDAVSPTPRSRGCAAALQQPARRPPARRVHGVDSERCRAARARSAGHASRICAASSAMFIKRLVDDSEAHACGVWLLDEATGACDLWMANIGGETLTAESAGWASLDLPRESMSRHLRRAATKAATGDPRVRAATTRGCPSRCARSIAPAGVNALLVAPLRLPPRTLGWVALSSVRGFRVRAALAPRAARCDGAAGDAGALLQPPRRSEPARSAAPGGARRAQPDRARHPRHAGPGLRRHPDAAAGGAARRRVEPAAAGGAQPRDRGRSGAHAPRRGAPIGGGAAAAVERARRRGRGAAAAWSIWRSAPATCRSSW